MAPSYQHTQTGYLHWVCLVPAVALAAVAWLTVDRPVLLITFATSAAVCLLLAASCYSMTVADVGDELTVRFGPVPLFHTSVRYDLIEHVEAARSTWLDGLGVHYVPGRGWIFNVHGRDCVEIRCTDGRKLRIGTDEPERLTQFVRSRVNR